MQFLDGSMPKLPVKSRRRAATAARPVRPTGPAEPAADDLAEFLRQVGRRVRTMRSRRGMSRKLLARHSKVSERYLAQLESGSGNFSLLLPRRAAHRIGLPFPAPPPARPTP